MKSTPLYLSVIKRKKEKTPPKVEKFDTGRKYISVSIKNVTVNEWALLETIIEGGSEITLISQSLGMIVKR